MNNKKILKNVALKELSRFKSGGNAEYYFEPQNQDELIEILQENTGNIPVTVIGSGSNLLIRDKGIKGLVINTKHLNKYKVLQDKIVCEAGVSDIKLYTLARDNELSGYEFLGTIPGTIGGACKMNAGCYGAEIKDVLIGIKTVDLAGHVKYFSVEECGFKYREINLSTDLIFLEAEFKITEKKSKNEIEETFKANLKKREDTQPYYENTCGSTFKNPENIPAWKAIQELGLQGVDFNGVKFSEKHANFLVNYNNATSTDIENLIDTAIDRAKKEENIILESEIVIIGEK